MMKVYILKKPYSDALNEFTFIKGISDKRVFDESMQRDLSYKMYLARGTSLKASWTPLYVAWSDEINPAPPSNLPRGDFSFPLILLGVNQRVVDVLGDVMQSTSEDLGTYGELLPLHGMDGKTYYLLNPPIIDVLDIDNSYFPYGTNYPATINVYGFFPDKLRNAWFFKIPQQADFFVTEQCKKRIEEEKLTNVSLQLVWDSENPDYQDERYSSEVWQRLKHDFAVKRGLAVPNVSKPEVISPATVNAVRLDEDDQQSVADMCQNAIKILNQQAKIKLNIKSDPKLVVEYIMSVSEKLRHLTLNNEDQENRVIELGILWGDQVCRAYGWHWAKMDDLFVIVSPDASLYAAPIPYMYQFFDDKEKDSTILLLFNMLANPKTTAKAGLGPD